MARKTSKKAASLNTQGFTTHTPEITFENAPHMNPRRGALRNYEGTLVINAKGGLHAVKGSGRKATCDMAAKPLATFADRDELASIAPCVKLADLGVAKKSADTSKKADTTKSVEELAEDMRASLDDTKFAAFLMALAKKV